MKDKKIRKFTDLLVVFPPLPKKKKILTELNVLPSMCLSKYNHPLHFREGNIFFYFSAVTFVYIRMRVELLYLLIEEFRFHIRRYRVVSSVSESVALLKY